MEASPKKLKSVRESVKIEDFFSTKDIIFIDDNANSQKHYDVVDIEKNQK